MRIFRLDAPQLRVRIREAERAAKKGQEICGLLVLERDRLHLVPVKNATKELGRFEIWPNWWRVAMRAGSYEERSVVGTYHSHIPGSAEPGEGDIHGAWENQLMLIISAWWKETRLWRIRKGSALPVRLIHSKSEEEKNAASAK